MTTIIAKVRNIINDGLETAGRQIFEFLSISSSKIFTLKESTAITASIKVYKNGVLWSDDNYTYDADTCQLTVAEVTGEELEVGDTLLVTFSYYKKYSDTIITRYINSALIYLSVAQYKTFTATTGDVLDPEPTVAEENLIALVASTLMEGNIRSYRTPEMTVVFGDTDSKDKKINQIIRKFNKSYGVLEYIETTYKGQDEEDLIA